MTKKENKFVGSAVIGHGTPHAKKMGVINSIRVIGKTEDRRISIAELENKSFAIITERTFEGEKINQDLLLSRETLLALYSGLSLYFKARGETPTMISEESLTIIEDFIVSDNLQDPLEK